MVLSRFMIFLFTIFNSMMIITTPTDIEMSGQRHRRARRMNGRRERFALGSVVDHGAEINTALDMAQLFPSSSTPLQADQNLNMSAQRQRRTQRMATRRQRLNLGSASDHAVEIAQVIHDFSTACSTGEAAKENKAYSLAYLKARFGLMPHKLATKMRKWFARLRD